MWQDVKSELRDVCTSQPQPLGEKYLFSRAARSKLLWATHRGSGHGGLFLSFEPTQRKGLSGRTLVWRWSLSERKCCKPLRAFNNSEVKSWQFVGVVYLKHSSTWLMYACQLPLRKEEKQTKRWNYYIYSLKLIITYQFLSLYLIMV